jgi:hypothetical protein
MKLGNKLNHLWLGKNVGRPARAVPDDMNLSIQRLAEL